MYIRLENVIFKSEDFCHASILNKKNSYWIHLELKDFVYDIEYPTAGIRNDDFDNLFMMLRD